MKRSLLLALLLALVVSALPLGAPAGVAEASGCKAYHVVARGEVLSRIAARYGVSVASVQQANNIPNRNRIYVGQRLCIPGTPPPPTPPKPQPGKCVYHTVQRGQTLAWIARHYNVTLTSLIYQNSISNPNRIYPGQRLLIYCAPPHQPPQPPPYYPPPSQPGDPPPGCAIQPVLGFGNVWHRNADVRKGLGCPSAVEQGFSANEQAFHSGYVVQDNDAKVIYVLFNNGRWESHPDTWKSGDPITNPFLYPPPGWYQPEFGIGKVWRNESSVSQRLGWARAPQSGVTASKQRFEHGLMVWTQSRGVFVLYGNGTWKRY